MLVLHQREKAKGMKCRVLFCNPQSLKHRVIHLCSLQPECNTKTAWGKHLAGQTQQIALPFLFHAQKNLDVLTQMSSSSQPSEYCNVYNANSGVSITDQRHFICTTSTCIFPDSVQVEMLPTEPLSIVWRILLLHLNMVFLFFPVQNSLTACKKLPCLKIKVSKSTPSSQTEASTQELT